MKVLVLGAAGMLGFAIHRVLADGGWSVVGTVRGVQPPLSSWCRGLEYLTEVGVDNLTSVEAALLSSQATVVINAIGLKSADNQTQLKDLFLVNAVFPRRLEQLAQRLSVRFIHISTDSVFGLEGAPFHESDVPNPVDLYSISKYLGETGGLNSITLRLSLVGRGLAQGPSLVDWFISQSGQVTGYKKAIFSALPANEIANVISKYILPNLETLSGVYNLSAQPISKFEFLALTRDAWGLTGVDLISDDSVVIDRTLDSSKFKRVTGYAAPQWLQLVQGMQHFYEQLENNGVPQ